MSELSPAAQAVWNAAYNTPEDCPYEHDLAAALRAAADHCHSQEIREADHTTRRWICLDDLITIADELQAQ